MLYTGRKRSQTGVSHGKSSYAEWFVMWVSSRYVAFVMTKQQHVTVRRNPGVVADLYVASA